MSSNNMKKFKTSEIIRTESFRKKPQNETKQKSRRLDAYGGGNVHLVAEILLNLYIEFLNDILAD